MSAIPRLDQFEFHHGPRCGVCHHLRQVLLRYQAQGGDISLFLFVGGAYYRPLHSESRVSALWEAIADSLRQPAGEAP